MTTGTVQAQNQGRVVRVTTNDPDIPTILQMGFRRLLVERSTDLGLSWAEITKPSERIVLNAEEVNYTFIDRFGDPSYKYRTRYASEDGKLCGDPSEPIDGSGALLLNVLTVPQLKQRYLFGIDLTDDRGVPLPDEVYTFYILAAIKWMEHQLDIKLLPTTIEREAHDYYRADYPEFNIIQLDDYPVISVEEFRVEYPSGQTVINYPPEWLRLDKNHGIVRIVPTAGTLSNILIAQGGSFLPAVFSGLSHLPDLFHVTYTAGFEKIPENILDLIGMFASIGPFNIFGDLITGAGIGNISVGMDGLSQSITTTQSAMYGGYGSRTLQYAKQIKEQVPLLRRYYKGLRMVVV